MTPLPAVLTIAGSDPSGGAGIQADHKTFAALGCYGASVITALTAQNTKGVQDVHPVPAEFVAQQLKCVLDDLPIAVMKTGMLYDSEIIGSIVKTLKISGCTAPLICDPVCISTSGHPLLKPEALDTLINDLFPLASLITPNKSEAEAILTRASSQSRVIIDSVENMVDAAKELTKYGPKAVLIKGGHFSPTYEDVHSFRLHHPSDLICDLLFEENMEILRHPSPSPLSPVVPIALDALYDSKTDKLTLFVRPRIDSTNTHGTGCTLSSAIGCYLAVGESVVNAVKYAGIFTHRGIENSFQMGEGNGPLNHLHSISVALLPRPTPSNPYPFAYHLISSSLSIWKLYIQHPFVIELMNGTLHLLKFKHFMIQDYHYLKYYARAYALLAAKSTTFVEIRTATDTILNVLHEVENTHLVYCKELGITQKELEEKEESAATTAYGAFIMDIGLQGDTAKLLVALLACLLGYGEVGLWIKRNLKIPLDDHPYWKWIREYSGEVYQGVVKAGLDTIENIAEIDPPSAARLREWETIWKKCASLEKGFWDDAMNVVVSQEISK
ncbi:Ribokinase-like protein [Flagelloscypha sp. PMI_526]|nr:Ribokinase-like protein [Flagelloscypha sp. PMI_526]